MQDAPASMPPLNCGGFEKCECLGYFLMISFFVLATSVGQVVRETRTGSLHRLIAVVCESVGGQRTWFPFDDIFSVIRLSFQWYTEDERCALGVSYLRVMAMVS